MGYSAIKAELDYLRGYLALRDWKFLKYLILKDVFRVLGLRSKHGEYVDKFFTATSITRVKFYDFPLTFIHRMMDHHSLKGIVIDKKEYFDVKRFIPGQSWTVLDVGANIGEYSLICSKLVGPTGKVIAIEPSPESFALLVENIGLNNAGNITAINAAVSDADGTVRLHIARNPLFTSIRQLLLFQEGEPYVGSTEVKSIKIDTICRELDVSAIDLLKIDVEGAEGLVLEGATRALDSCRKLIIETHSKELEQEIQTKLNRVGCKLIYQKPSSSQLSTMYFERGT
jgi:FkbM family methyltransferase